MKLLRLTAPLLAFASFGCTGQINGSSGNSTSGVGNNPSSPSTPGNSSSPSMPGLPPKVDLGTCTMDMLAPPRTWRLTTVQLKNTLNDALGFMPPTLNTVPPEGRLDGFANQAKRLEVAPLLADYYLTASDEVASEVVRRSDEIVKCPIASLGAGSCLGDFIKTFGLKMWRRPVSDAEAQKLTTLYGTTSTMAGGPEAGLRNVVQAFFMSPNFLYRSEVGDNQTPGTVTGLTSWELASSLSYMLWDAPPDATLMDLATQNKLRDPATLTAQAKRLLASPRAQTAMTSFVNQWLRIEDLTMQTKDPIYSLYNIQVGADLLEEARLFFNSVMFDPAGDRSFKTLFTAQYGFVNARTAPIYGIANVTGTALTRTNLDPTQRRGLLTLAGFVSGHSDPDATALVSRGRYLREEILCASVPDPDPRNAVFDPAKVNDMMTGRERLTVHASNPACATCHTLFDALGFAMEQYDPIGRYRTMDVGKMIDPSGSIPLPSGGDLKFNNFVEMVDNLAKTSDVYSCFSAQYLSYATGRARADINTCETNMVSDAFTKSGYKMDTLVMSVVNSPSFIARKN